MFQKLGKDIYDNAVSKGFYENGIGSIGTRLMLIVSELSEALEADRNNRFADLDSFYSLMNYNPDSFKDSFKQTIKDSFEDEMADSVIRILDLCYAMKIDIGKHIELKMKYNSLREYKHGKNY